MALYFVRHRIHLQNGISTLTYDAKNTTHSLQHCYNYFLSSPVPFIFFTYNRGVARASLSCTGTLGVLHLRSSKNRNRNYRKRNSFTPTAHTIHASWYSIPRVKPHRPVQQTLLHLK